MSLTPGLLLSGRYRLTHRIAIGGMGEVWTADDTRLARRVAVKILRSELTSDPEFVERFRAEARVTASLNHPGIAAVYDYGEVAATSGGPRNTAFLVMELVVGEPLSAVLARRRRLSVPHTLDLLEQSGRALQAAHSRTLVHRDIKPGNILITPTGQVKITDFGIAKVAHQVPVTRGGLVTGTAQYLSPEQAAGHPSFPASDVYSLGVVAYECLAGVRPFNGNSPLAVAMSHVRDDPPLLPPDIPPPVAAMVLRMLAKDPAHRFADGVGVARAVAAIRAAGDTVRPGSHPGGRVPLTGHAGYAGPGYAAAGYAPPVRPPGPPRPPVPVPFARPVRRRTGIAVVIVILILILVGTAGAVVIIRTGAVGSSVAGGAGVAASTSLSIGWFSDDGAEPSTMRPRRNPENREFSRKHGGQRNARRARASFPPAVFADQGSTPRGRGLSPDRRTAPLYAGRRKANFAGPRLSTSARTGVPGWDNPP